MPSSTQQQGQFFSSGNQKGDLTKDRKEKLLNAPGITPRDKEHRVAREREDVKWKEPKYKK